MAENKTIPTGARVEEFLSSVEHPVRREDGFARLRIMSEATGQPAAMWGPSTVGFGSYHYRGASREGYFAAVGYSPRKANLALLGVLYGPKTARLLPKLGKHKIGVGCLYINKLDDVDLAILEQLRRATSWTRIARSFMQMVERRQLGSRTKQQSRLNVGLVVSSARICRTKGSGLYLAESTHP